MHSRLAALVEASIGTRADDDWALSLARLRAERDIVDRLLAQGRKVYGFNTLVGHFDGRIVADHAAINDAILRSHCFDQGRHYDEYTTRFIGYAKAYQLSSGGSGIDPDLFRQVVDSVTSPSFQPAIPSSLSYSCGDVIPAAHWAREVLSGAGLSISRPPAAGDAISLINGHFVQVGLSVSALLHANTFTSVILASAASVLAQLENPPDYAGDSSPDGEPFFEPVQQVLTDALAAVAVPNPPRQNAVSVRGFSQVLRATVRCLIELATEIESVLRRPSANPLVDLMREDVRSQASFLAVELTLKTAQLSLAMAHLLRCYIGVLKRRVMEVEARLADTPADGAISVQIPKALEAIHLAECEGLMLAPGVGTGSTSEGIEDYWTGGTLCAERLVAFCGAFERVRPVLAKLQPGVDAVATPVNVLTLCCGTAVPLQDALVARWVRADRGD